MRPEKAKYLVSSAIESFYRTGNPSKLYLATKAIRTLDTILRKEWDTDYGAYEYWTLTDKDYLPDSVLNTALYISDRFMAPHRIGWLLNGVTRNKFIVTPVEN